MGDVYMSHILMKDIGMNDEEIPYCHHMIISEGEYTVDTICPINDPRVEQAKKDGKYMHEVPHCSVHYFNDVGYLRCSHCGWTP